jgi:hypothetical protein
MPLQNRVRPDAEIVASSERGLLMGNRGGKLHDPATRTLKKSQSSRQWICCVLQFKNRKRTVMGDGYTELFFLDEVTALAAGHRPCFECRRAQALAFRDAWQAAHEMATLPSAPDMDAALATQRRGLKGVKLTWNCALADLPDGTFVRIDNCQYVISDRGLLAWSSSGYAASKTFDPGSVVEVLTPPSITRILRQGYDPVWHPTANRM